MIYIDILYMFLHNGFYSTEWFWFLFYRMVFCMALLVLMVLDGFGCDRLWFLMNSFEYMNIHDMY